MAPATAAVIMVMFPTSDKEAAPNPMVTIATANPAPAVMPSISGPATGFRKKVCMSNPASGKASPHNTAARIRGNLVCQTMTETGSAPVFPLSNAFHIF